MIGYLSNWFGSTNFMPHGYCFLWEPSLLWVVVSSDLITAASYFSIPFALWYFVQKRPNVPFRWVFMLFGVFVLACGVTHLFSIWNIWHADYWAEAMAKAVTAAVSAVTAILLWPMLPKALLIPSTLQLESANRELRTEALRRQNAESAMQVANDSLERSVAQRTAELEQVAESLRQSEARFRSLTEMSSDFYWESDTEHRLTARGSADKKSSTVSVFQRGAQIGERRWEIPHLSPDADGWKAHRAVLDAHLPFRDFGISRLGTEGSERHISISGDPVFDTSGTFTGYRGVGTDITERKRAEDELRARETRYAAIANSAADAFITSDGTGRIVAWNPSAERMFGYAETEASGQPLTMLIPQRFQDRHLDGMKRVQSSG